MMKPTLFAVIATLALGLGLVNGHGMIWDPVNRASRWRFDSSAPTDNNDNGLNCGGVSVQWNENGGKCGLCGDNYQDSTPRAHENGGKFGQGVIVKKYSAGSVIPVRVRITANHRGSFKFTLCNLDEQGESEQCFNTHQLNVQGGGHEYELTKFYTGIYKTKVVLPQGVRCNHCVLRWVYVGSSNQGTCEDGSVASGCGPQPEYRSCSDIAIN